MVNVGLSTHLVSDGKHKINLNQEPAQLEAKLAEAQKQNSQAQTGA